MCCFLLQLENTRAVQASSEDFHVLFLASVGIAVVNRESFTKFRPLVPQFLDPDRCQNLISYSLDRAAPIQKISSSSFHNFLSNLADRQTDRQTGKT